MKKRLPLIISSFLVVLSLLLLSNLATPTSAQKTEDFIDQMHAPGSGAENAVIKNYNWGQQFTPTANRITRVYVELENRVLGSNLTMTIKDKSSGFIITSASKRMSNDYGWESFIFDSPKVVEPGNQYVLVITTSETNETTTWVWNEEPGYDGGRRERNGNSTTGDFGFAIWGLNEEEEESQKEEPQTQDENSETTDQESTSEQTTTNSDTANYDDSTSTQDTAETQDKKVAGNDQVAEPKLVYVDVEGEPTYAPIEDTLAFYTSNPEFKVVGSAPAETKVVFFIDTDIFSTTTDENGIWEVSIDPAELRVGEHQLTAQTQTDDGKGSTVVKLLNIRIRESEAAVENTEQDTDETSLTEKILYGEYRNYTLIGLGLAAVLLVIVFFAVRKKNDQKKKEEETKKKEEKDDDGISLTAGE